MKPSPLPSCSSSTISEMAASTVSPFRLTCVFLIVPSAAFSWIVSVIEKTAVNSWVTLSAPSTRLLTSMLCWSSIRIGSRGPHASLRISLMMPASTARRRPDSVVENSASRDGLPGAAVVSADASLCSSSGWRVFSAGACPSSPTGTGAPATKTAPRASNTAPTAFIMSLGGVQCSWMR